MQPMRDPRQLDGRVAVVTGVGRRAGIGYAIARRLLGVRRRRFSTSGMDAVRRRQLGRGARRGTVRKYSPRPRRLGHVDILVVNHTRSGDGALADLTAEHLDDFLHENVRASLLLVKRVRRSSTTAARAAESC